MNERNFYVYEHWRPDKGECFYVGKGLGRRAYVLYESGRSDWHLAVQSKLERLGLKVEIRIAASDLSESDALVKEVELISFWREQGHTLVNLTAGGEGGSNPSESTRALMRAAKLGRKLSADHIAKIAEKSRQKAADPEYRKRLSIAISAAANTPEAKERARKHFKSLVRTPEHCARIAASKTGLKQSPDHAEKTRKASLGRKQTREEIERRRLANTGKKRSEEFRQKMRELQMRPDIAAAKSLRMKELNSRPDIKDANRLRLIERNKSWTGKKRPRNNKQMMLVGSTTNAEIT